MDVNTYFFTVSVSKDADGSVVIRFEKGEVVEISCESDNGEVITLDYEMEG